MDVGSARHHPIEPYFHFCLRLAFSPSFNKAFFLLSYRGRFLGLNVACSFMIWSGECLYVARMFRTIMARRALDISRASWSPGAAHQHSRAAESAQSTASCVAQDVDPPWIRTLVEFRDIAPENLVIDSKHCMSGIHFMSVMELIVSRTSREVTLCNITSHESQ
jgi:hypothetical protein